jgi:hypothetical protein
VVAFASLADIAAAATAVGVFFAAWALFLQRGQARTQFEDAIGAQYRELIRPQLLSHALLPNAFNELPELERDRSRHVYLYLDLCNEQVFLRAIGRVSRSTWTVQWAEGIRANLQQNEVIARTWQLIKQATDDFDELRVFEASGWKDPRSWEPFWRRYLVRFGLITLRVPVVPRHGRIEGGSSPET